MKDTNSLNRDRDMKYRILKWIEQMAPKNAMELDDALRKHNTTKAQVADAGIAYAYKHIISLIKDL